jgi:hypothetical protein
MVEDMSIWFTSICNCECDSVRSPI